MDNWMIGSSKEIRRQTTLDSIDFMSKDYEVVDERRIKVNIKQQLLSNPS
jgi:hypothetical protein